MGATSRRSFAALAAIALAEMGLRGAGATAQCATGNCSGGQECCDGFTCTPTGNGNSKTCVPDNSDCPTCEVCDECPTLEPGPWPCVVDGDCGDDLICDSGACCSIVQVDVGNYTFVNVSVPVTVINTCFGGGGGRRKRRKHRKH